MPERALTAAERDVLESVLPEGLTPDMQAIASSLYRALVVHDPIAGQTKPNSHPPALLLSMALGTVVQLQFLCAEMGGTTVYLAKGLVAYLSSRDRRMCSEFRGSYKALARKYDLTEMRVRQIISLWQREQFLQRQQCLPGLDD